MAGDIDVGAVHVYQRLVDGLLERAAQVKPDKQIEPPLTEVQLGDSIWAIKGADEDAVKQLPQPTQYAAVEIAFREKFYGLLATTSIDDPAFINIWNLLDIISIFSDNEQCEPGLIFWLIEELLDSQTIDGCRKVFDYLESRRELNTKKHFKQKSLIILRSCNELLRRLSRAEDTVFCGRVFIFLFQSFPLGDKSSVNLRGEYHTENVTTFDEISKEPPKEDTETDVKMSDVNETPATEDQKTEDQKPEDQKPEEGQKTEDQKAEGQKPNGQETEGQKTESQGTEGQGQKTEDHKADGQKTEGTQGPPEGDSQVNRENPELPKLTVSGQKEEKKPETHVDLDALYPMFWGLQAYFSAPTKVFDSQHFASFKTGLEATLSTFKSIKADSENQSASKASEDLRRAMKRKRTVDGQEFATSFNPKYLTSRDLFDLEVSDTAFRRHVLVQALILLDFMLSLTPKAKTRLSDMTNKSVLYAFVLNDEDAKWATEMRKGIEEYLQQGVGGKFYYRMVDTVLSRDKNWVRWKAEGCPPIERPPVSVTEHLEARERATKVYANKRLRSSPAGALDLKFLSEGDSLDGLREPDRFSIPDSESLMKGMANDDLDLEMAQTKDETNSLLGAKTSKAWRILRLSMKNKLSAFEKIDDGKNMQVLFDVPQSGDGPAKPATATDGEKAGGEAGQGPTTNTEKDNTTVERQATEASKA